MGEHRVEVRERAEEHDHRGARAPGEHAAVVAVVACFLVGFLMGMGIHDRSPLRQHSSGAITNL
jgi:hypothetical protein